MSDLNQNPSNESKLNIDEFKSKSSQNLPIAVIAGAIAAVVSAAIWAAVTVMTDTQIGWMAVGVGFLVGLGVRLGKGVDPIYRIIAAVLALLGCILGNVFTLIGIIAAEEQLNVFTVLIDLDYSIVPEYLKEMFSPIDLLFYALAIYFGHKYSVKEELVAEPQA